MRRTVLAFGVIALATVISACNNRAVINDESLDTMVQEDPITNIAKPATASAKPSVTPAPTATPKTSMTPKATPIPAGEEETMYLEY